MRYYDQSIEDAGKQLLIDLVVMVLIVTWPIWWFILKALRLVYSFFEETQKHGQ